MFPQLCIWPPSEQFFHEMCSLDDRSMGQQAEWASCENISVFFHVTLSTTPIWSHILMVTPIAGYSESIFLALPVSLHMDR